MKPYTLTLSVRDAKFFRPAPNNDTHKMIEADNDSRGFKEMVTPRKSRDSWVECPLDTFLLCHVSNMLHVLAGERPQPTFRRTFKVGTPQKVQAIEDIARGALVRVTSGIMTDPKTEKVESVYGPFKGESMMTRKTFRGSLMPVGGLSVSLHGGKIEPRAALLFTWDRFKCHLGLSTSQKLVGFLMQSLGIQGNIEDYNLLDVLRDSFTKIPKAAMQKTVDALDLKGPWRSLLLTGYLKELNGLRTGYGIASPMLDYSVSKGREFVVIRDAQIHVPVTESEFELFRKGPGWATLIGDGLVTIESLQETDAGMSVGFVPVYAGEMP